MGLLHEGKTMSGRDRVAFITGEPTRVRIEWVTARFDSPIEMYFVPLEPPTDLAYFDKAAAIVVDGRQNVLLAVAECARVRATGLPIGLLASQQVDVPAMARAGVIAVLQTRMTAASVKALLTRLLESSAPELSTRKSVSARVVLSGGVSVDRLRRTLSVEGREHLLSKQKFELLCYLIDREGVAVQPSELVQCGILRPSQARRFKGLMQELRTRLGSSRDILQAVPGYGYRLDLAKPSNSTPDGSPWARPPRRSPTAATPRFKGAGLAKRQIPQ